MPEATLEGAAFMDTCSAVTGQSWKFVPEGDGLYRLQSLFLESEGKCLEGNTVGPNPVLDGAAYMEDCGDSPGQLWSIVHIPERYFYLRNVAEGDLKCLDGNEVAPEAPARGGAFMNYCGRGLHSFWFASPR